jgi:hypothetical protein
MLGAPLTVVARLAAALQQLRVAYAVGGSLASSLYGVPRATNDVDVIADLRPAHVARLVAALEGSFYVDEHMIHSALADHSSFNVFDRDTMMKVDVFVPKPDEWIVEELVRAHDESFEIDGATVTIRFASAEDTLLYKLVWYRLGGEQSERQWDDVRGIFKVQGEQLDRTYLHRWARHLRVTDLLERAMPPSSSST